MTEPIKVFLTAGAGRSGSTLLDRRIGQLETRPTKAADSLW